LKATSTNKKTDGDKLSPAKALCLLGKTFFENADLNSNQVQLVKVASIQPFSHIFYQ